jgi:hypothetical protein
MKQKLTFSFCTDCGSYLFPSKKEREAFFKKPKFNFDFCPSNVDDQTGLKEIFGTDSPVPIFENNSPNFTTTYLEKDPDDDLVVIVSVEIKMTFEIIVTKETFKKWVESDESTWNSTGRIVCEGEVGLNQSDREEYEFHW